MLAVFLCAAPLLAATAQASTSVVDRAALREALRSRAHSSDRGVVRLPLPEAPRASSAAARAGLARLASAPGPARLLVGVRSHEEVAGVAAKLRALGAEPERFDTIAVLAARVPSAAAALAALRGDPRVAYVERDEPLRIALEPFDTIDPFTQIKYTWAYDAVRAGEALFAVGGGSARTVSVIDTGLDVNHPEFAGQVQQVFDTEAEDTNVTDIVGHGTFVTGLIAARDGNTIGGKGVAGSTKVLGVRASRDREGRFSLADLIAGIEFSIRRGADVINMSLAAPGASATDCRYGVFSTIPPSTDPPWDEGGCPKTFIDPSGSRFAYGEGTSFAAPIVSGLAALAWQAERRLASEQVADVMVRAANGTGWNEFTGAGGVDGMRAVEIARVYDVLSPRARARTRRRGNRVRVTVRRSRDRTMSGDELAGRVTYGLLVSRNAGRSFRVLASRRPRPFRKSVAITGRRTNLLISTACDGNGNCGVRRLGRFRRRR